MTKGSLRYQAIRSDEIAVVHGPGWTGTVESDVETRALRIFSLLVMDALRDAAINAGKLSDLMKVQKAGHFMRYGAARRLRMMWHCYRNVVHTAPSDRVKPLSGEDSGDLTRDLNVIYINIRGVLDNFAWSLLHERAPEEAKELEPQQVGFFNPCIVRDSRFAVLAKLISEHESWHRDVKKRRDPAAHRIPLTVPPQIITPEEAALYQRLYDESQNARGRLDFAAAENAMDRMEAIGRFSPCFMHDPEEGVQFIYPTVPEDIGHVVDLFNAVEKFLLG
jgi:hypothetical protein